MSTKFRNAKSFICMKIAIQAVLSSTTLFFIQTSRTPFVFAIVSASENVEREYNHKWSCYSCIFFYIIYAQIALPQAPNLRTHPEKKFRRIGPPTFGVFLGSFYTGMTNIIILNTLSLKQKIIYNYLGLCQINQASLYLIIWQAMQKCRI